MGVEVDIEVAVDTGMLVEAAVGMVVCVDAVVGMDVRSEGVVATNVAVVVTACSKKRSQPVRLMARRRRRMNEWYCFISLFAWLIFIRQPN